MKYFKTLVASWIGAAAAMYAVVASQAGIPAGEEKTYAVGCAAVGLLFGHLLAKATTEPVKK